jgi:hypothetical protein
VVADSTPRAGTDGCRFSGVDVSPPVARFGFAARNAVRAYPKMRRGESVLSTQAVTAADAARFTTDVIPYAAASASAT